MSSLKESQKDDIKSLKQLGSKETHYKYDKPNVEILETFENKYSKNTYMVEFEFDEFTSLCPKTGQPDFGSIRVEYFPDKRCIETKSLKLYLFSYRSHKSFMETITNKIMEDLVKCCDPIQLRVFGTFKVRGGVRVKVISSYFCDEDMDPLKV